MKRVNEERNVVIVVMWLIRHECRVKGDHFPLTVAMRLGAACLTLDPAKTPDAVHSRPSTPRTSHRRPSPLLVPPKRIWLASMHSCTCLNQLRLSVATARLTRYTRRQSRAACL